MRPYTETEFKPIEIFVLANSNLLSNDNEWTSTQFSLYHMP